MNQEKVGQFIAKMRKEKNMTQEELAEKLGVNSRSISRWENAKCMPDLAMLIPLSKELEVSVNDLISGEKVQEKAYKEKLEENIVTVVSKVERKNKTIDKFAIGFIVIISLALLIFYGYLFYTRFNFDIKYDENKMEVGSVSKKKLIIL